MKIKSEYNGIKHGELCSVWDDEENLALEAYFLAYINDDSEDPIVVVDKYGAHSSYKNAKKIEPIKLEAEKFLAKWGGKKIWQEGMERHAYHLVTGVMDHSRGYIKTQDGKGSYIVLRVSDNWQLWESPVKLDTRKVAGWWSKDKKSDYIKLLTCVHMNGTTDPLEGYTFSQDPMKPLDQWQTLSEICGGES